MASESNAKKYIIVALVAIVALLVVGYRYQASLAEEAWLSFGKAMDAAVGANKWSAESHDFSLLKRSLFVNRLKFSVDVKKLEEVKKGGVGPLGFTVEKIAIKNGLRLSAIDELLGFTDWRSRPETLLVEELVATNVQSQFPLIGRISSSLSISSLAIDNAKFKASGADEAGGYLGFLRNLRLDRLNLSDFAISLKEGENQGAFSLGTVLLVDPRLAESLVSPDDPLFYFKIIALSCEEFRIQNAKLNFKGQTNFDVSVADVWEKGVEAKGRVEYFSLKGYETNVYSTFNTKASLGSLEFVGLDYSKLLDRITPHVATLIEENAEGEIDPDEIKEKILEIYDEVYTLANMITQPFDLEKGSFKDFHFSINDALIMESREGVLAGPFKAGRIPPMSAKKFDFSVKLPKNPSEKFDFLDDAYKFGRDFGQNEFKFVFESKTQYDPQSGHIKTLKNEVVAENLLALNVDVEASGLTETLMAKLDEISFRNFLGVLGVQEVMDLSLINLSIVYQDFSAFNKVLAYLAKTSTSPKRTVDGIKAEIETEFISKNLINNIVALGALNADEVKGALLGFLASPDKLSFGLSPKTPYGFASVALAFSDRAKILNDLGIFVTSGDNPTVNLKWANIDPPNPFDAYDPSFQEKDLSLDEDDD
jgi:hypothetical protein